MTGDPEQQRAAREARDWLVRLNSGAVDPPDLARFRQWRDASDLHRRAFARERAFWQQLGAVQDAAPPRPAMARRGFLAGGAALAAGLAGVVVLPRVVLALRADFQTAVGRVAPVTLPDGSVATLNTDSAIAWDFQAPLRQVRLLKGEAGFAVPARPGAPFRVTAAGIDSEATESEFSVRLDGDGASVTVLSGSVRLTDGQGGLDLQFGQQARYAAGLPWSPPAAIDADRAMAWRQGRIIFEGQPFGQALSELDRYVPERVMAGPGVDATVPVSGIFRSDQAFAAIDALARTQGLRARRVPGVMILIA